MLAHAAETTAVTAADTNSNGRQVIASVAASATAAASGFAFE